MDDNDDGGDPACWAHLFDAQDESMLDLSRFDAAYQLLADAVVVADRRGTIRLWNEAATDLFGWSAKQAVGEALDLIIPEKYRDSHWRGYEQVMATGQTSYANRLLEVPALHMSGQRISIAFTVSLLIQDGVPAGVVAVVRDETARREELMELRRRPDDDR